MAEDESGNQDHEDGEVEGAGATVGDGARPGDDEHEDVGGGGDDAEADAADDAEDADEDAADDGLLTNQGIAHVWEAGTLVVRSADEAAVDQIIDDIEMTTLPALDPDADKLAYEVGGWTDEQRSGLADALGAAGIAYEWDEVGDLLVLESDEARVEEVLDTIEFPDALDAALEDDPDDGLAAQQVMSELFVSSDRLMHDARDPEGVLSLVDAAARARGLALPFGFEREVWDGIVARAGALSDQFERDVEDDDEIIERATELRNLLRSYV